MAVSFEAMPQLGALMFGAALETDRACQRQGAWGLREVIELEQWLGAPMLTVDKPSTFARYAGCVLANSRLNEISVDCPFHVP